ncbi:unnamed protein product [Euphydryas editha]|uniref:Reverse transcriptase domain-containing protein n=1 Tax=Euphydryas editha TaxID=104508 RepID=A0AAU9UDT3_EUPED|nr:unnamed protein product [Euphydryas editha]
MSARRRIRPSVPGGPTIPGHGSGCGNGGAEGAKNLRGTGGCFVTNLATYNGRSLRLDHHLTELEVELSHIKWSILGLSEVRRQGEDTMILDSGHLFYFREGDGPSQGGVGFLVHKTLSNNVVEVSSVSTRVAYLVLKLTDRYSLKVIQVYAPTSTHSDDEVEALYEDISKALHGTTSAFYNVVMGDFNAKVGVQDRDESVIGPHGLGRRNRRGQMLVDFLESEGLFLMNSFFQKKPQRRWTWQSPDTVTRNEIDFIIADKMHIFRDVSVVNRFNTGSDHRLLRGSLNISLRKERVRLMKSIIRPTLPQILCGSEQFQLELQNRFDSLETTGDVDLMTDNVVKTVYSLGRRHFTPTRPVKQSKISPETLDLMRPPPPREMPAAQAASPEQKALSKRVRKLIRRDLRCSNTRDITTLIEQNRGSKVFRKPLGRSLLAKLKTADGRTVCSRPQIREEVEKFYGQLYSSSVQKSETQGAEDPRAPLLRHYSEDVPDFEVGEISAALGQLKNGRAPGDDGVTTELLKAAGRPVLEALARLFNAVIQRGTTPEAWSRSVVVLFYKRGDKSLLKNYRPISLLSHVYKLFSRVVTNRLATRLDDFQPPEQAGFRKGYSTVDHIHTVRQIIQKTEEYNQPLCMAFVDYEKAFDSIETWAVLDSLQRCHIDWRYIEVLRCMYDAAKMTVHIQDQQTRPIFLRRGVRQGDRL